jgi:ferredoxin-NADP reductase
MAAAKYELEFAYKKQLTPEAFEFYFKRPEGLDFEPGQYLKYSMDLTDPDDRGSSRYFTISSSPLEKEYITLTTRVIKSSFKVALSQMKPGERIRAFGPLGYFTLDLSSKKDKIFLAGGIGVTPYHSVLQTVKDNKNLPNIFLFDSWPTKKDAVYYEELKEIERMNPSVKVIYTLTREEAQGFEKGRINPDMIAKYVPNYKDCEFFIVGSEEVEAALLELVKSMGVAEDQIFSENFPGY